MDDYKDILAQAFATEIIRQQVSALQIDPSTLLEMKCYQTIKKIKAVLEEESLDDATCFWKIEEIICHLEDLGLSCGNRHDFG